MTQFLDPDWRIAHKLASTWIAAFWGAFGSVIWIFPTIMTNANVWWVGPLMIFMSVTFAVARFTNQPGAV
jgi:hypothetical protein